MATARRRGNCHLRASFLPNPGPSPHGLTHISRQVPPHLRLVFPVAQLGPGSDARKKKDTTGTGRLHSLGLPQRDQDRLEPPGS